MSGFKALIAMAILWLFQVAVAEVPTNGLLAFYPLRTNVDDSLGNNPPFVLTNAPFGQAAAYVNGFYEANGHFVNYLATSPLQGLRFDSFTISLDFCPEPLRLMRKQLTRLEMFLNELTRGSYAKWIGYSDHNQRNILTGGQMYRWIGFNREGNRLNLTLNNQQFTHRFSGVVVNPNRWHNLICSFDLRKRQILTFFDGQQLDTIELPEGFKMEVLGSSEVGNREREFGFVNYSNGSVYRGYAANLKIFGRALTANEIALLTPSSFVGLPTFQTDRAFLTVLVVIMVVVCLVLGAIVWSKLKHRFAACETQPQKLPP